MKLIAKNKKAIFNYEKLDVFDAGLVLLGWEVKSIKTGNVSLKESYIVDKKGELWLIGCHVGKWPGAAESEGQELRPRKLLLNKSELLKLTKSVKAMGIAIVLTDLYLQAGKIKATIALARGKKLHDKRAVLKERDMKRDIAKDLAHSI